MFETIFSQASSLNNWKHDLGILFYKKKQIFKTFMALVFTLQVISNKVSHCKNRLFE